MYFLWFCIYRTITEPLAGSTECGEPQPTTVKVVTALMLENAKTNKKGLFLATSENLHESSLLNIT